jgi:hypothetical protein
MSSGRATLDGTADFAARLAARTATGHFRRLGNLTVSSIGIGTYLGPADEPTDLSYQASVVRALEVGLNVIDTASNYRHQRSERAVGRGLIEAIERGIARREEVVVASKAGFLPFDGARPADPRAYIQQAFIDAGLMEWDDVVAGCHSLAPASLREQIEGTVLDTPKTQSQLDRIAKVLAGKFGKVGTDVRRAILEMFNDISSAFKDGDKKTGGQVTQGGIKSITNLIKGLGLTPEQEEALRARARPRRRGAGAFGFEVNPPRTSPSFTPSERDQLLEFNIFIDGKDVEAVVTRRQQKRGQRSAPARRGRHGGRNLGLG